MTKTDKPLDFLWFIPTSGDGAYLGSDDLSRPADIGYFREIATAADRLGYSGVLIPTGVACEESFILAAHLAASTENLKFLVAIRPGIASPAYYARLAATLDRVSRGRLLLNIVARAEVPRSLPATASSCRMTNAMRMPRSSSRSSTSSSRQARRISTANT
ncbi:hypothetical protein ABIA16_001430 [Sinorhizobium fredii]